MGVKNENVETAGGETGLQDLVLYFLSEFAESILGVGRGGGFSEKQICTVPLASYETMTNAGSRLCFVLVAVLLVC